MLVCDIILDDYQAQIIADDLDCNVDEAARRWFIETFENEDFTEQYIAAKTFVCQIPELECDMYYDYGADYYFLAKSGKLKGNLAESILSSIRNALTEELNLNGAMPLLRKMSKKAKFKTGKYANQTVEAVLEHSRGYVAWTYFNVENISFTEDILEELGIVGEFLIDKPGKNPDMYDKWNETRMKDWSFKFRSHVNRLSRDNVRQIDVERNAYDTKINSKYVLQAKNHGRI